MSPQEAAGTEEVVVPMPSMSQLAMTTVAAIPLVMAAMVSAVVRVAVVRAVAASTAARKGEFISSPSSLTCSLTLHQPLQEGLSQPGKAKTLLQLRRRGVSQTSLR